jgi:EpsI family protein
MTMRTVIVAMVFAATFAFTPAVTPAAPSAQPALSSIPMSLESWSGAPAPDLAPEVAAVLAADQYLHRYYTGPQGTIEMDVAYYTRPRVGANMHSPLNCLPGNGWQITNVRELTVATTAGSWPIRELLVERGSLKYVLAYWFQTRSRIVSDEFSSRLYLLADALRRRPVDTGLVRLIVPAEVSAQHPTALPSFASVFIPALTARLQ